MPGEGKIGRFYLDVGRLRTSSAVEKIHLGIYALSERLLVLYCILLL